MRTFPVIRCKFEAKHSEYQTKRAIPEIYYAMAEVMKANNHGGMSSGYVDPELRRETGIPLLHQQFQCTQGGMKRIMTTLGIQMNLKEQLRS